MEKKGKDPHCFRIDCFAHFFSDSGKTVDPEAMKVPFVHRASKLSSVVLNECNIRLCSLECYHQRGHSAVIYDNTHNTFRLVNFGKNNMLKVAKT